MAAPLPTALDQLLLKEIASDGTPVVPTRTLLNFAGSGVSVADDPVNGQTTVTIPAGPAVGLGDIAARVVATTNQTLSGLPTIDTITLTAGQVTLLTAQTTASQNGVYAVAAGAWSRVSLVAGENASGARVFVDNGYYWQKTRWECISDDGSAVVGTNSLRWRRVWTLLDDFPFDASDLAYYLVDESTDLTSIANRVTGGPSLPLAYHLAGVNSTLTADYYLAAGPFGGTAWGPEDPTAGFYGTDSALDLPDTFHISAFFNPSNYVHTASNINAFIFGRTKVTPATSVTTFNATNYAATFGGNTINNAVGEGSLRDYSRRILSNVNVAGTLRQLDITPITAGNFIPTHVPAFGKWCQLDQVRTDSDGIITTYVNGLRRDSAAFVGALSGTGAGYWFLGCPFNNGGGLGGGVLGMPGRYSRVRIMDTFRGVPWIRERYARMAAWVGG